jgi:hypothetical protein
MLCTGAQQFVDWSAAYRLFAMERFDRNAFFMPARCAVLERLPKDDPMVIMMDDTLIRKRGRKVAGTGWKRDPLGPKFRCNFVWGQRFLQISSALPDNEYPGRARGIPIDFIHAPSAVKPHKNAAEQQWKEYRDLQEATKISRVGVNALHSLRDNLNKECDGRPVICAVDGGFTNRTVFRNMPENTTMIGRLRKDAVLFSLPGEKTGRGRPRWYGERLPTPEQVRQDTTVQWEKVEAFAAGKRHAFEVKRIPKVRWSGTANHTVQVVIVRPLAYRPRKGARLLYRDPAYLICTDPDLPLDRLLQAYLWRWEIEVNFRDEKTLLGAGEAQVRKENSVQNVPAFIVASYAFLLLAGTATGSGTMALPRPKWQQYNPPGRCTTQQMISLFRSQLWGQAMQMNLRHFASNDSPQKPHFFNENSLPSAVCYAAK